MPRPRTAKPRNPRLAALGQAIESVIAENPDMTQESVAFDGDLDPKQVGTFVRGQGNPTYETLLKLCKGLHMSLSELTARAGNLEKNNLER
jgi:DNA-binding phage protein